SLSAIIFKSNLSKKTKIYFSNIEEYSYVGEYSKILNCKIGKFCSIGSRCEIGVPNHITNKISTSPVFFGEKNIFKENFSNYEVFSYEKEVIIGNDVWIGTNVLIKPGVIIGDGAIIGMGSIVTHDVQPYTIVAGNPAKKIKSRFNDFEVTRLQKSKWFDYPINDIKKVAKEYLDPIDFIDKLEEIGEYEK
ncbi:CatB-related O-acetyltransferase, partial [Enterococcus hirae]